MTVQFRVTHILRTTAPAKMLNHNGAITINLDCPVGNILAYDRKDNLYICRRPELFEYGCWKGPQKLYRDYWTHIQSGPGTPYGDSFRNVQTEQLN